MIILVLLSLLFSGCASVGNKSIMNKPADWPPLTMTKAQLIHELGPPKSKGTKVADGKTTELYGWIYGEATMFEAKAKVLSVEFDGEQMVSRTWSESVN